MSVIPQGNRRQMEHQEYRNDLRVSQLLDSFVTKVADTLNLEEEKSFPGMSDNQRRPPVIEEEVDVNIPDNVSGDIDPEIDIQEVMNQSDGLPEERSIEQEGRFETKVNDVAQAILSGLNLDPSQWTINTNVTSKGEGDVDAIAINMKKAVPESGPEVQKP